MASIFAAGPFPVELQHLGAQRVGRGAILLGQRLGRGLTEVVIAWPGNLVQPRPIACRGFQHDGIAMPADTNIDMAKRNCLGKRAAGITCGPPNKRSRPMLSGVWVRAHR
jgi:hypothetical protein